MSRDLNDIERDIERSRKNLASTLDELAERVRPANLVDEAKTTATSKLSDPKVQQILAGIAGAVTLVVVVAIVRNRSKHKNLRELQRLLAERS